MRSIALVISLIVGSAISANAQTLQTPAQVLATYQEIMRDIRADQEKYCAAPRSNNSGRCHADFLAVYPKLAEMVGWQLLYIHARNTNDTSSFQLLWDEYQRAYKLAHDAQSAVERTYYPQKASAVQQPTPVAQQR